MTEHADQLREAFETHENQTPDPAAVFARVQQLSQKYRRRRRNAVVAGGAFLGVGLIAGVPIAIAGVGSGGEPVLMPAAAPPSAASPASTASDQVALDAYFKAGYDYDDAMRLAVLWHRKADAYAIKAEAGRKLLAGETLPFAATPDEEPPATPDPVAEKQWQAFFGAGYVWEDAVKLAQIWKLKDPADAKIMAGKKLLAHQQLPIKPRPANIAAAREARQVEAFFNKGYDVDDAVQLAKIWKLKTAYDAKALGGKKLLAGETLPIQP